jgi:hypothetical protein
LGNAGEERCGGRARAASGHGTDRGGARRGRRDLGVAIRAPEPLAGSVAEIGDRLLAEGYRADLVTAAPAYGREPNARKPEP